MTLSVQDAIALARWQAVKVAPYLGRALWVATFIESEDVPTMGVDEHWRVYCNPAYVRKCAKENTLVGELLHEVMHPTMRHRQRALLCRAEDHPHWNACGDAEIDQQIEAMLANYHAPTGLSAALVDNRIRPEDLGGKPGMTAEELYRLPRKKKDGRCSGGKGVTAEGTSGPGPRSKDPPGPGLSEAEADIVRASVAQAIQEHVKQKGRGSVPAGVLRWAESFGEAPPVDWRALVSARVRYAIDTRRGASPSYARPARRKVTGGIILPVHRMPIAKVTLVIDTSGSMGGKDLGSALSCVFDACEALGRVSVVSCDAAAGEPVDVVHLEDLREHLRGGGGTDMRIGIARADEHAPDAIVVVSDGETPWPEEPPSAPLTVVLTRPPSGGYAPPAWCDVIQVPS
jgi:predicted metal-dependent peptidase